MKKTVAQCGKGMRLAVALMVVAGGCRFEGPGPEEGSLEYRLTHENWSSFSELFSSNRGYRVAFLPFNVLALESGRMSDTWRLTGMDELRVTNYFNHEYRYRWFPDAGLFAYCREGMPKPFFIAHDSLSSSKVFARARAHKLDTCTPSAVLRMAGGRVVWSDPVDRVRTVDLSHLSLSRQDRQALRNLGEIETLILADAALRDADLAYLTYLTSLTNLTLAQTAITDDGLKFLTGLPIQQLDLSSTGVSDQGVMELAGMTTLERVYLHDTPVSRAAVDYLQKQLPNLSIYL